MNNPNLVFISENRSKLYYNKYQYRARIKYSGLYFTSYTRNSQHLTEQIKKHKILSATVTLTDEEIKKLGTFVDWKKANKDSIIVRTEMSTGSVFLNDLSLINTLSTIFDTIEVTESLVTEDPSVVTLNKPKHKFRVYLRNKTVPDNFFSELDDFFTLHKSSVFPCKSLLAWIYRNKTKSRYYWNLKWLSNSHFIEYDNESSLTLMNLYLGDIFGKNYKVVKR